MKGGYPPARQVTSFSAQDPGVRLLTTLVAELAIASLALASARKFGVRVRPDVEEER